MMHCPVCDAQLRAIEKYGVEIDICPGCKGVWLDRGELEKILAMDAAGGPPQEYPRRSRDQDERRDHDHDHHSCDRSHAGRHGRPYKKKREGLFGEIFDMFGD